jgi:hypothetical protein
MSFGAGPRNHLWLCGWQSLRPVRRVAELGSLGSMTIRPHSSVADLPFGAKREALHRAGSPVREGLNRLGELELDYGDMVYRFEDNRFVEATFPLPIMLEIGEHRVDGHSLVAWLRQHDPFYREAHGFAIAPSFGIAVDLDDADPQQWTTAFAAGRWDKMSCHPTRRCTERAPAGTLSGYADAAGG